MYNKVDEKFLAGLQAIVGKENVYTDPETLDQYKTDEETDPSKFHTPEAVVAPGSTEEVAAIVKLANEANIPITVRSAGTSLADGAIAVCGGIILLMGRMNRILEVNTEGLYLVAEAGALVKVLNKLGEFGYNMSVIHSRPLKGLAWSYYFYIEAEGEFGTDAYKQMISEMEYRCNKLKVLGRF